MVSVEEVPQTPVVAKRVRRSSSVSTPKVKVLRPFNTSEVKILLLENVNETAIKAFKKQGYQVKPTTIIIITFV
jgi:D-3-phosphoglycerate dehydrogenase